MVYCFFALWSDVKLHFVAPVPVGYSVQRQHSWIWICFWQTARFVSFGFRRDCMKRLMQQHWANCLLVGALMKCLLMLDSPLASRRWVSQVAFIQSHNADVVDADTHGRRLHSCLEHLFLSVPGQLHFLESARWILMLLVRRASWGMWGLPSHGCTADESIFFSESKTSFGLVIVAAVAVIQSIRHA